MLPKKTISTFIDAVDSRIPPPVHTAALQDSRPVPAVIIENMSIDEKNYHNSHFAGSGYDSNGNVQKEIFRHYYDIRFELVVRDDDEVDAFDILGDLKLALAELSRDPQGTIHGDVNDLQIGNNGKVSYQFYEPVETEINQTVSISTFYESQDSDLDIIETVDSSLNIS